MTRLGRPEALCFQARVRGCEPPALHVGHSFGKQAISHTTSQSARCEGREERELNDHAWTESCWCQLYSSLENIRNMDGDKLEGLCIDFTMPGSKERKF